MTSGRLEAADPPLSRRVRRELDATDWETHAIVDVVTYEPATSLGFEDDRQRIEVYRYGECAPPVDTYENGERDYRVQRVTRPVYERTD